MPKMHIDKSVVVNAKAADIYSKLKDFHHWTPWSPWLITEPEAKVDVADDGLYYEWEGDIVGAGNMSVESSVENERVDYDLTFLKPWKSKAKVSLIFKPEGDGTRVHWTMDSSLPFFMFWMKKMMVAFIGMDYQRGLNMIKDYIEDGEVHSKLTFKGYEDYAGCKYVGIKTACAMDQMGDKMKADYERLMPFMMQEHKDKISDHAFSIYHKWEVVKNQVVYTAAVPVSSVPDNLQEGMFIGEVPATRVHSIHHKGPYAHIGNAWSAQYMRHRNKVFKPNKKIDPMEVYLNSPKDTPELELESEIRFAVLN